MWTFALAHNIVLGDDHPRDAVILSSLPPFWLEVVDGRFVQVKEHIEDAENLVRRYIDGNTPTRVKSLQDIATTSNLNFESSPGGPQNVLASLSISERDVKDTSTSSTFSLEKRPTESQSILIAKSTKETHIKTLQQTNFKLRARWAFQDKKVLESTIKKLAADNDALWKLIGPNQLNMMTDAVSSKLSLTDLEIFAARITTNSIDVTSSAEDQKLPTKASRTVPSSWRDYRS